MSTARVMAFVLAGTLGGSTALAGEDLAIEVVAPKGPQPLDVRSSISLKISNRGKTPIAVAEIRLIRPADVRAQEFVRDLPVTLTKTGAVVDGVLQVEDIGPQARLPPPPVWRWKGKESLTTVLVLVPGSELRYRPDFIVTERVVRLEAEVRWAPAETAWGLQEARFEPVAPEPPASGMMPGGLRDTATLRARYGPGPATAQFPDEVVDRGSRLSPYGLPRQAFEKLAWRSSKAAAFLEAQKVHCTLAEARKRAAVAKGETLYSHPLTAWALQSEQETALVHADRVARAPGRFVAALAVLNEAERVRIELFSSSPEQDPDGLLEHLRAKGFEARVREQKGGTWQADLEVDADGLLRLAPALAEKGRRLEGLRAER